MFSRVGWAVNLPSSLTPSVGSGANRFTESPPGPISTSLPARSGLSRAKRTAVPPPSELPTSAARSMLRWSNRFSNAVAL